MGSSFFLVPFRTSYIYVKKGLVLHHIRNFAIRLGFVLAVVELYLSCTYNLCCQRSQRKVHTIVQTTPDFRPITFSRITLILRSWKILIRDTMTHQMDSFDIDIFFSVRQGVSQLSLSARFPLRAFRWLQTWTLETVQAMRPCDPKCSGGVLGGSSSPESLSFQKALL